VDTELAWAAGFFDGEGCVSVSRTLATAEPVIQLSVSQVQREPLDRFAAAVGVGKVYGPYTKKSKPRAKPCYQWSITGSDADAVFERLRPHLCAPKIEKYEHLLEVRTWARAETA